MAATTYPAGRRWSYTTLSNTRPAFEKVGTLELRWELDNDPISDYVTQEEASAEELWAQWISSIREGDIYDRELGPPWVHIHWSVAGPNEGTYEAAPFQRADPATENFLTFYSVPVNVETGDPINWLRLPVRDKLWRPDCADTGGFIQELSGWRPHALQQAVDLRIFEAAGLGIA